MKIDFRWGIPVLRSLLGGKRFLLLTHNLERGGKERERESLGGGGGRTSTSSSHRYRLGMLIKIKLSRFLSSGSSPFGFFVKCCSKKRTKETGKCEKEHAEESAFFHSRLGNFPTCISSHPLLLRPPLPSFSLSLSLTYSIPRLSILSLSLSLSLYPISLFLRF